MASKWAVGAVGGAAVVLVALFTEPGNPARSYYSFISSNIGMAALFGWIFRLMLITVVGAVWVLWNNETVSLKAFQLGIAAPAALAALLGIQANTKSSDVPLQVQQKEVLFDAFWAGVQGKAISVAGIGEIASQNAGSDESQQATSSIIERFSGANRRSASDALSQIWIEQSQDRASIVNQLFSAILPASDQYGYRVNLYIVRTLGILGQKWNGSEQQKEKLKSLKSIFNNDQTMNYWVDRAVANA
ncbi:hypothetical protein IHQ68_00240 [Chelatococcus sambhunathii]|uniref:Uncharacterized protein n=1 Tax=Chelatococcus sambhunathii TaxID=363953 RepID=A0ABU1DAB6_9HYPH|nr:hypothetical protein [Chelatococcus sambhunathii]MDR4305055.1 hypothetical protein [Chelatococcus sambhunathii]